jgi:hypothetical protein
MENKKEIPMSKNYTTASAFVFCSLALSSLVIFSNFAKADPAYCAYLLLGATLVNAISTYFIFSIIPSPEQRDLEEERNRREKENREHYSREEIESIWRVLEKIEEKVDNLSANCKLKK